MADGCSSTVNPTLRIAAVNVAFGGFRPFGDRDAMARMREYSPLPGRAPNG